MQERGAGPALTPAVRRWALVAAVAAVVVALDQASKWWALQALDDRDLDLVGSLRLHLVFNPGASFGLGSRYTPVLTLAALAVVLVLLRTSRVFTGRWPRVATGLVLGGALGNLLDRLFRDGSGLLGGRVVDFIDVQWWPVFNVADIGITVGAVLLAVTAAGGDGDDQPGAAPAPGGDRR